MSLKIKRVYVEKKAMFQVEAEQLKDEYKNILGIGGIENIRVINRYDLLVSEERAYEKIKSEILSEPNVDLVYENMFPYTDKEKFFAIEYLPGQFEQKVDSTIECIRLLFSNEEPKVRHAKVIVIEGNITDEQFNKIKEYSINPVDSREASFDKVESLEEKITSTEDITVVQGFINFDKDELLKYKETMGFAMSDEDLIFVQNYFAKDEQRDPTITELKVIDTYWSDHCRHTTFLTELEDITIEEGPYKKIMEDVLRDYLRCREELEIQKPITLMDLGTINAKYLSKVGLLDDLDKSDEINACSIKITVDVDGRDEEWLLMFKNETHNHPTEIEPFGGASTCLGGAIRDPLSGRSYVYQAMRVSGSGDVRTPIEDTLPGKLPQRVITKEAARGYSYYGNQIGLTAGEVAEYYHDGFVAKRMEAGAVVAAAPRENVVRKKPEPGDIVVLVGAKTGRDGIGGATVSSKIQTDDSQEKSGAEVPKGNPPEERKLQRLFRRKEATRLIKKCNDFGAGGVSVAIGELADSLEIDLDKVPTRYPGLDGTEIALSESQERMAVVLDKNDLEEFTNYAEEENLEVTKVATITDTGRLIMTWKGKEILNLSRDFLDTNGAKQYAKVKVTSPEKWQKENKVIKSHTEEIKSQLKELNNCSQKGISQMFDSTIGAGTVLMPYGGKYALTPVEGMVAKIPVLEGNTNTCSLMTHGYDPDICSYSPFHGGIYSVVESVAKIVAMGGDRIKVRLSFQEYFQRLDKDPEKWGQPFSALLGAFHAQMLLDIAAIGGKDSMSGTFNELTVPPTLISFAVTTEKAKNIISPEFKKVGSKVYLVDIKRNKEGIVDFENLKSSYDKVTELIHNGRILSAKTIKGGGIAVALCKMSFGNKIGFELQADIADELLYKKEIGNLLIEVSGDVSLPENFILLGVTIQEAQLKIKGEIIDLESLIKTWQSPLNDVFPLKKDTVGEIKTLNFEGSPITYKGQKFAHPRVFIPIFPGTNSEYDLERAFKIAGANTSTLVFKNRSAQDILSSIQKIAEEISKCQILAIPGGSSGGDEPDGAAKFITNLFRNNIIANEIMDLLNKRDGLILGICNGFQALIKLGLVPYGEIRPLEDNSPALTYNNIGRSISAIVNTKVVSTLSPWLNNTKLGDIYKMPISHGQGRFVADENTLDKLIKNGQIATQYVDENGNATYDGLYNPGGSLYAVEGLTSPDGRVFGKMGHSERVGEYLYKNIPGEYDQKIFLSGVEYFK